MVIIRIGTIFRISWAHLNGEWVSEANKNPGIYLKWVGRGGWAVFWISLGFSLFTHKLGFNISISQASWEDGIMPGQHIAHCWRPKEEARKWPTSTVDFPAQFQGQVYPESEAKEDNWSVFRIQVKKDEDYLFFSALVHCTALASWGLWLDLCSDQSSPRGLWETAIGKGAVPQRDRRGGLMRKMVEQENIGFSCNTCHTVATCRNSHTGRLWWSGREELLLCR